MVIQEKEEKGLNIFAIKLEHPHPYKHWRYLHEYSSLYFWKQTTRNLKKKAINIKTYNVGQMNPVRPKG